MVGVADDGGDESAVEADGDGDVDRLEADDGVGFGVEAAVDVRVMAEG